MIFRRASIYESITGSITNIRRASLTVHHCLSLPLHRPACSVIRLPHRLFSDVKEGHLPKSKLVIAQSAVDKLTALRVRHPTKLLRVAVEGGGCHGFKYTYGLEERDKIDEKEDALFTVDTSQHQQQQTVQSRPSPSNYSSLPGDTNSDAGGRAMPVIVDSASLELLNGSTLVYTEELIGRQFAISGNSIADSGCGCGISFGRKFV